MIASALQIALAGRGRANANGPVGGGDMRGGGIGVREDRHGLDAQLAAGPDDANRNLAAVRDEQSSEH